MSVESNFKHACISDPQLLLQQLGQLPSDTSEELGVVYHGHVYSIAPTSKENFLIRFFRFIFWRPKPIHYDSLRDLKPFFEQVLGNVKANPSLKPHYAPLVSAAFENLRKLFEVYRHNQTIEGMLKRNDLLEAFSVACRRQDSLNEALGIHIQRIAAVTIPIDAPAASFKRTSIPLIKLSHMQTAVKLMREAASRLNKAVTELTLSEAHEALGPLLMNEQVPMGRVLDAMYGHGILRVDAVNRLATRIVGRRNQNEKNVSARSIAKFLKSLNIPVEVELNKKLYAYSETYQKALREERSNDAAFRRDFRREIIDEILLKDANEVQNQINRTCGEGNIIISNSYNRLRMHRIDRGREDEVKGRLGGVHARFNITGKMMSHSEKNQRAAKNERSYIGNFAFSIKNMLGSEDNRQTDFHHASEVVSKERMDCRQANRLLLDCMTNMIDREETTMIVQRLAPVDEHHFAAPVEGRVLSREESCRALQQLLEQRGSNPHELAQLRVLEQHFVSQTKEEREQATINIQGTQSSVNTKALTTHSEILAQNDRKIMLMQHKDGAISVHAFIGATGVNMVDVTARPAVGSVSSSPLGTDIGSMGFGDQPNKSGWQRGLASGASIQISSKAGNATGLGAGLGSFDQRGSTVVSLYFNRDIVPTNELEAFTRTVRYKVESLSLLSRIRNVFCSIIGRFFGMKPTLPFRVSRSIEAKAALGDVIALPKAYVALKALTETLTDSVFNEIIQAGIKARQDRGDIVSSILERFRITYDSSKTPQTPQDRVAHELWLVLNKASGRSFDDNYLLSKIQRSLSFRVGG